MLCVQQGMHVFAVRSKFMGHKIFYQKLGMNTFKTAIWSQGFKTVLSFGFWIAIPNRHVGNVNGKVQLEIITTVKQTFRKNAYFKKYLKN